MEGRIKNNLKEVVLAFIMGLIVAAGVIASAGAFNYAVTAGILFVIAGVLNLGVTAFSAIAFYKKYLKPSIS